MLPLPKKSLLNQNIDRGKLRRNKDRDPSLLWLDRNENTDPTLASLTEKLLNEIIPIQCISVYPELTSFYDKLSKYLSIPDSNIIVSTGSDGVIRSIYDAYCSYEDKVIITNPSYAMYEIYGSMYGANLIKYDYLITENGPKLDFTAFLDSIKKVKPKIIFIANPDSPTGTVVQESKLLELIKLASDIGSLVVIDEAYYPFYNHTMIKYCNLYRNLIVIRTFSKAWGISGLRVGFGVGSEEVISMLRRVRSSYETNFVGIQIANKMLDYEDQVLNSVKRLNEGREFFYSKMNELGLKTIKPNANFLHVKFGIHEKEVRKCLSKIVLYRNKFDHSSLNGYSRFSTTTKDLFIPVADAIEKVIKKNS